MKKSIKLFYSLLAGVLLVAAWPVSPFTLLLFFAWLPLLFLADNISRRREFAVYCFVTMLTWNAGTTWWIWNADPIAGVSAIVANSLLMCLPWWLYRICKRRFTQSVAYTSLVVIWISFEYIHLNWELSWPWLTLGNAFAMQTSWVQWYEFTGTSGGSLWVLVVNILLYNAFVKKDLLGTANFKLSPKYMWGGIAAIALPIAFSLIFFDKDFHADKTMTTNNVVIVQPNIDPYSKQDYSTIDAQVNNLITLTKQQLDSNTRLVIWPETAVPLAVMQNALISTPTFSPIINFAAQNPKLSILTGVETYKTYGEEKETPTARLNERTQEYYDAFNAATILTAGKKPAFYNKSKLVPGVESLPSFLNFMGPIFEKFGGTTGGYGVSKEASILTSAGNVYKTAPIICYESIYGEYVSTYVKKGANILTIITNDGWWKNTPGHRQHLNYARLRAIETRRWVARSANTGISAVIDDYGSIKETRGWGVPAVIKYNIPTKTVETFYVKYGDLISKAACFLATVVLLWLLFIWVKLKVKRK